MNVIATKRMNKRPLYSQEIRETIQSAIMNGQLRPGDRVVETRLAKELGVSQSPVREAIRELEVMGLIEIRPFQGAYVKALKSQDVQESYKVRSALESAAIEALIPQITEKQIEDLAKTLKAMAKAGEANNIDQFTELDKLFHQKIVEWSGNQLLLRLWEQCKIMEYTKTSALLSAMSLAKLAERHDEMLGALEQKDIAAGATAVHEHFDLLHSELEHIDPVSFLE